MAFGGIAFGAHPYGLHKDLGGAPRVLNWVPFVNAQIARLDVIGFDVVAPAGLESVLARAIFRSGESEVVFRYLPTPEFGDRYWRGSGAREIANGLRFIVRRTGGWPSAHIRFYVTVRDIAGQVTLGQASF